MRWNHYSGGYFHIGSSGNPLNNTQLSFTNDDPQSSANPNDTINSTSGDSSIYSVTNEMNSAPLTTTHELLTGFTDTSILMFDAMADDESTTAAPIQPNPDHTRSPSPIQSPNISPILRPNPSPPVHTDPLPMSDDNSNSASLSSNPNTTIQFDLDRNTTTYIETGPSTTRMQLRIPLIIQGFNEQWSIKEKIHSVMEKLTSIDPYLTILPWATNTSTNSNPTAPTPAPLLLNQMASQSVDQLKTYFARINQPIRTNSNFIWVDFRMQHSVPWITIKNGIAARLQKRGYSLYPRQLQSEKEVVIGWLLWSFREQDAEQLAKMINKKYNINTYLRWATINIGTTNTGPPIKALHIVSSAEDQLMAIKSYNGLYKMGQRKFPLGMKMRFIPMAHSVSPHVIDNIKRSRAYQQGWLNSIEHTYSTDIQILDKSSAQMPTLRDMICRLTSSADKRELFQGVNRQWNDPNRFIFTYRKQIRTEARSRVSTLLTYLKHTSGHEMCTRYFSDSAVEAAQHQIWDEELKDVIQLADLMIPIEAINADADYFGIPSEPATPGPEANHNSHAINVFMDKAPNSVKTFTSANASINSLHTSDTDDKSSSTTQSPHTNKDTITSADLTTLTSTLIQINKKIAILDANVKNNNHESEEILGKLIVMEKLINTNGPSLTNNHMTDLGNESSIPGRNK